MEITTTKISHPALTQLVFYGNIHDERLQEEKNQLIQNLEIEIDNKTQAKVKESASRFILLVGDGISSLEATGSYVYCVRGSTEIHFHSFGGMNEEETERILKASDTYYNGDNKIKSGNLIDSLRQGCAVFLGNMECRDSRWLKRFTSEIGDIKSRWYYENHNKGILIISTIDSMDSLPKYFTEVFEVINLEPEKEGKTVDKPETKPKKNTFSFPTPPGSKWSDVEIRFVNETTAIINVKGEEQRVDFAGENTGFKHKQSGEFTKLWNVFKIFAESGGVVSWNLINQHILGQKPIPDDIRRVKKTLKDIFGIPGSPIAEYKKGSGWEASFKKISTEWEDTDGDS